MTRLEAEKTVGLCIIQICTVFFFPLWIVKCKSFLFTFCSPFVWVFVCFFLSYGARIGFCVAALKTNNSHNQWSVEISSLQTSQGHGHCSIFVQLLYRALITLSCTNSKIMWVCKTERILDILVCSKKLFLIFNMYNILLFSLGILKKK